MIDATKTMLLALWREVRDVDTLSKLAPKRDTGPMAPLDSDRMRMTAVPTTLSAAEFTSSAGISDVQRKVKLSFSHPRMTPIAVILDPAATLETPMALMLSTGMRAMDHAVERWCSIRPHPLGDGLALQAMTMLAANLPAIKARPDDLDPRLNCQLAAWLTQVSGIPACRMARARHRLHTRSLCRRSTWNHVLHLSCRHYRVERVRQCRASAGRCREARPPRSAAL